MSQRSRSTATSILPAGRLGLLAMIVTPMSFFTAPADADAPADQYAVTAGTVLDNRTGLVWQQASPTTGGDDGHGDYNWANASSYCSSISLNGSGWRMPTVTELATLVDFSTKSSIKIDKVFGMPGSSFSGGYFWSATPDNRTSTMARSVNFMDANVYTWNYSTMMAIRCVR